jgi:hypothetical protein
MKHDRKVKIKSADRNFSRHFSTRVNHILPHFL